MDKVHSITHFMRVMPGYLTACAINLCITVIWNCVYADSGLMVWHETQMNWTELGQTVLAVVSVSPRTAKLSWRAYETDCLTYIKHAQILSLTHIYKWVECDHFHKSMKDLKKKKTCKHDVYLFILKKMWVMHDCMKIVVMHLHWW